MRKETQHLRALAAAQGLASPAVLRCNGGYELADCVHVGRRRIGYHDAPQQIFTEAPSLEAVTRKAQHNEVRRLRERLAASRP